MRDLRHDWTLPEIESIYATPLPDRIFRAQSVHRIHHRPNEVQGCSLLTGVSRSALEALTSAATDARATAAEA